MRQNQWNFYLGGTEHDPQEMHHLLCVSDSNPALLAVGDGSRPLVLLWEQGVRSEEEAMIAEACFDLLPIFDLPSANGEDKMLQSVTLATDIIVRMLWSYFRSHVFYFLPSDQLWIVQKHVFVNKDLL